MTKTLEEKKEYQNKYNKKYRLEHKQEIKRQREEYLSTHKKEKSAYDKEYRRIHAIERKESKRQYYLNNKAKSKASIKQWRIKQPKGYQTKYQKRYYLKNKIFVKVRHKKYIKTKYHSDHNFKLRFRVSQGIRQSLKRVGKTKASLKWESIVGYTKEDLQKYLFKDSKYTLEDYLTTPIDIDHKTPLSWFKDAEAIIKVGWALENLQLLPRKENREKLNKYCSDLLLTLSQIGR